MSQKSPKFDFSTPKNTYVKNLRLREQLCLSKMPESTFQSTFKSLNDVGNFIFDLFLYFCHQINQIALDFLFFILELGSMSSISDHNFVTKVHESTMFVEQISTTLLYFLHLRSAKFISDHNSKIVLAHTISFPKISTRSLRL